MPQAAGADRRAVRPAATSSPCVGGAYFFLPGLRALRYLATRADREGCRAHERSNAADPAPRANTGSALLNWISDTVDRRWCS